MVAKKKPVVKATEKAQTPNGAVRSKAFVDAIGKKAENLIPFTSETAQKARLKGLRTRLAQKKAKEDFVNRVKVYHMIMHKLPVIDAELVIRMRIHMALQEQDFEDAARWAKELLEFQKPKLARQEIVDETPYDNLTVEQLRELAKQEGLLPSS